MRLLESFRGTANVGTIAEATECSLVQKFQVGFVTSFFRPRSRHLSRKPFRSRKIRARVTHLTLVRVKTEHTSVLLRPPPTRFHANHRKRAIGTGNRHASHASTELSPVHRCTYPEMLVSTPTRRSEPHIDRRFVRKYSMRTSASAARVKPFCA